jgi:cobalamin biosynthesis protein CobT
MPPPDAGAVPPDLGKLAKVTPDQPEYLAKLANLYADDISAGFAYAIKLAEEMVASEDEGKPKEESEDEGKEEGEEKKEESKEAPKEEASEAPAEQPQEAAVGTEQPMDASAQGLPGGMPGAEGGLPPAGGLPGAEGGLPGAPIDAMGSLAPSSPEEQQALAAVMQELNIDPAMMQQIMAAAPQAGQDKMASAKVKYRAAIFNKLAQML